MPIPPTKQRRLISSDESVTAARQHERPCSDCPWARASLPGWLGGGSVDDWLRVAHSDTYVPCHVIRNQQCAGLAIYRRNTCKRVEAPLLVLPRDTAAMFATPMEFRAHHQRQEAAHVDSVD